MSIGRQSMYDTFGDKHQLYLETLQLYEANSGAELFKRIYETPSPFVAICDYILSIADGTFADRSRGCFYVSAPNELAPSDPDVPAGIRARGARGGAALRRIPGEATPPGV